MYFDSQIRKEGWKTKQPKEKGKNNIVQKNTMMNIYTNTGKKK